MTDLFRIGTNVPALRALYQLNQTNQKIVDIQQRMATGKTVNRSSDDPALFLAARKFETSISAYVAGQKEIERGMDWLETQNSRLDQIADIIIEMTNLANTANSGAITSAEQQAISREMSLLVEKIDNILLSGVSAKVWTGFSIGTLSNVSVTGSVPTSTTLALNGANVIVTGTSSAVFDTTLNNLESALNTILNAEETLGTYIKRLEFEHSDMEVSEIAARSQLSTITEADLAEEQVNLTALQILQQASIAGLIQANSAPSAVLGLIQ